MMTKILNSTLKSALVVLFALLAFSCVKDEVETTGTVYGVVIDSTNGEPIRGANVSIAPGGKTTNTGSDGRYDFQDLTPGQYTIQISREGYKTNTKIIDVVAGIKASGDMVLVKGEALLRTSTRVLNFGTSHTSLSFGIINAGMAGKINWYITGVNANWVTVSPTIGSTDQGKESSVIVEIDRSKLIKSETTSIIIEGNGESISLTISAEVIGDPSIPGGATIESCDPGITIKVLSSVRSNSLVQIEFSVENTGIKKDLEFWGINWGNSNTSVSDNLGNSYSNAYNEPYLANSGVFLSYVGRTGSQMYDLLPRNIPKKGKITIKNFDMKATSVSCRITCRYNASEYQFANDFFFFKNIPVR